MAFIACVCLEIIGPDDCFFLLLLDGCLTGLDTETTVSGSVCCVSLCGLYNEGDTLILPCLKPFSRAY